MYSKCQELQIKFQHDTRNTGYEYVAYSVCILLLNWTAIRSYTRALSFSLTSWLGAFHIYEFTRSRTATRCEVYFLQIVHAW